MSLISSIQFSSSTLNLSLFNTQYHFNRLAHFPYPCVCVCFSHSLSWFTEYLCLSLWRDSTILCCLITCLYLFLQLTFNSNPSSPCSPVFYSYNSPISPFYFLPFIFSSIILVISLIVFFSPSLFFQSYLVTNILAHTVLYSLK